MSRVKSKDTKPELTVKKILLELDSRFVMHRKTIPGSPDFAYLKKKKAIFVHGCFWHRHAACHNGRRLPKSKLDFWVDKLDKNRRRDAKKLRELNRLGWSYIVVWECGLNKHDRLRNRLRKFVLGG